MQLDHLIKTRRTVHNFTAEKVDEALVLRAIEASLWAPNHKQTYPWVYTLVGAEARLLMGQLAVSSKRKRGELSDIKAKAIEKNIASPSHILSLGLRRTGDAVREKEDYATLSCSVQILSMVLWEFGIATKWSTGGWAMGDDAYTILGLDPAQVRLEGALMIGKPQIMPEAPVRPPLEKVLRRSP